MWAGALRLAECPALGAGVHLWIIPVAFIATSF
jgi:hypothetical protein